MVHGQAAVGSKPDGTLAAVKPTQGEYLKRFKGRFRDRTGLGFDWPEAKQHKYLLKVFPHLSSDEWEICGDANRDVNCHALANGTTMFDQKSFKFIHPDLPQLAHISVWARAIGYYGFRPGISLPNRMAVITDSDGYVWHSVLRCDLWWLSKLGPWKYVYHRTLRQIMGGLYGDTAHIFSSL